MAGGWAWLTDSWPWIPPLHIGPAPDSFVSEVTKLRKFEKH